ncbi:hypothetical protein WR25_12366 [Diploscapter pachys]|uniref:Uncharacterized protein n=1 Tax=Diploscapter pachys TaxID=2018661 RepID=A0A2A2J9I0_9BILA|nr:hypothetical protein WR25_12366 [Diploscapter pachys]
MLFQVLAQGVLLTEANVSEVVDQVTVKFNDILIKLYEFSRPIMQKWGQLRRRHRNKFDSFTEVNARGEIEYDDMAAYQARKQLHRKEVVKKYGRFFELPKGSKEADNSVEQHLQELKDATFPSRTNLFRRETSLHDQKKIAWNVTDEQRDDTVDAKVDGYIHPEWSLVFMLRLGLVATQMMPENTQSGIIVITDAVCGIPDQEAMQKLLAQLRSYTVSCSFIQLQANTGKGACFGHVPSSELVHFIAMATFGSYISPEDVGNIKIEPNKVPDILKSAPGTPKDEEEPTNLQNIEEALLCWSFQNALQQNANVVKQIQSVNNEFLTFFMDDVRRHVHLQVQYQSNLHELLYVRLREGFALKEVRLEDDGRTIYVLLVLPFRSQLFIEYTLRAPWPASKTRGTVFVELILQGPTFELREILSERKHLGADRQDLVKITLNSIVEADALLLQLHEFNTRPCHYRIPKGINPHEGLFTIHNGLLRTPYAETKKLLMNGYAERIPFAEFWSTLLDMNDSLWQKWVHTHSERIVLKSLLPFDIFGPESAFRINCSDSESALHTMLQEMTSFSVIPDKLYVKFVCGDNKDAPEFFYIIRVCLAAPTVVLRISFLGGIRNHTRRYIVDSLRDKIRELNQKKSFAIEPENGQIRKGECPDTNVLFAIRRPMERILVRYDTIPLDLKTIVRIRENVIDASLDQIKQIKRHNAICSYMECRRQIIILPDLFDRGCFSLADNWDMAAFILNVLLQRRASEREGYQLAAKFESGAIALCRQRYHKIGPCLEQYVLFPPLQVELPTALRTNECKRVVTYNYNVLRTIMQPEENEIENRENVENLERKTKKVRLIDAKMEDSVDEPANRPVALVMETWNEPQVNFGNTQSEARGKYDEKALFGCVSLGSLSLAISNYFPCARPQLVQPGFGFICSHFPFRTPKIDRNHIRFAQFA